MKKIKYILILAILTVTFSCKKDANKEVTTDNKTSNVDVPQFVMKPLSTSVEWTGFKTTDKTPVKGKFTKLEFKETSNTSVNNVLNGLEFSIPVSSIFSNDAVRDGKLKSIFFAAMDATTTLKGTLRVKQDSLYADLTMNNVTKQLPLTLDVKDERRITINGTIDLKEWQATKAIEALHKACFDLHKGADGVSKTWDVVDVTISSYLAK